MEKTFLVVLLLCVSGLLRPSGVHLVLGLENETLLPSSVPEQPNTEGHTVERLYLFAPIGIQSQVIEETVNHEPADESVHKSTVITTTIEELSDAFPSESGAAILDHPTTLTAEKAISTDKGAPPPPSQEATGTDQETPEPQEAVRTGHEDAPPKEAICAYQEVAPPLEGSTVDQEAAPPQEAISAYQEVAPPRDGSTVDQEAAPPQETISTDHEIVQPQEDTSIIQETAPKQVVTSPHQEKGPNVNVVPDQEVDGAASSEEEEAKESCEQQTSTEGMHKFAEDMTAFTIDLFKQIDQESSQPNIVLSPLSIALGLSQLALGAGPETEKKLLQALHVDSSKCLHKTLKSLRRNLGKRLLRIATRMYIRKGFEVKEEFQKRSEGFYGAKPVTLGPSKKNNLGMINRWVKEATDGQISEFLSQVPDDLVLLLINAMNFKGIWMRKFNSSHTSEGRFYLSDKQMVPVQMMRAPRYPLSYFHLENVDALVARLPFKGNMSFIVILPNSFELDIVKLLDEFNQTEMYNLFKRESTTLLKIPRLHLDFKLELSQALTRLGLGELFFSPDLRGISDEALSVSSVQHQSTLQLNEDGVEASAVTSLQVSRSFDSFSINRPFVFFLLDDITGMPLFLGRVRNPNPGAPVQITNQSDSPDKDDKFFMKGYNPK